MKDMMLIVLTMITLGVAILTTLFFSSIGLAATNTSTVLVNVSELGQLSVSPASLSWSQVVPGNNGTDITVTLTNTGSTAFTTGVYANVNSYSVETANPLRGVSTAFAGGSYLVLKNSSDTNYHFVNRMEWNDSSLIDSITTGKDTTKTSHSYGKYYNKTDFWVWEISNDVTDLCTNTSNTTFKIQPTQGSYSLTGATSASAGGNNSEWSTWTIISGPLADYCVAIKKNCQSLMIYRWDYNATLPACGTKVYINKTLAVGASLAVTANVFIPSGTPSGNASSSTLTFTAT